MSPLSRISLAVLAAATLAGAAALPFIAQKDIAAIPAHSADSASLRSLGFTSTEKKEIGTIARDYLLDNPEVLQEMATLLQARESEKGAALRQNAFLEYKDIIYTSPHHTVLGNPQGDVTLVEFFDYNCGYCRSSLKDIEGILSKDPNIKVILKEYPVLGAESHEVSKVSAAIRKQGNAIFQKFHHTVMSSSEHADGASALEAAKKAGADMNKLISDLADPSIEEGINETLAIGQRLGIDGTPSYILGETVIPGAVGEDKLTTIIANIRSCNKVSCP